MFSRLEFTFESSRFDILSLLVDWMVLAVCICSVQPKVFFLCVCVSLSRQVQHHLKKCQLRCSGLKRSRQKSQELSMTQTSTQDWLSWYRAIADCLRRSFSHVIFSVFFWQDPRWILSSMAGYKAARLTFQLDGVSWICIIPTVLLNNRLSDNCIDRCMICFLLVDVYQSPAPRKVNKQNLINIIESSTSNLPASQLACLFEKMLYVRVVHLESKTKLFPWKPLAPLPRKVPSNF